MSASTHQKSLPRSSATYGGVCVYVYVCARVCDLPQWEEYRDMKHDLFVPATTDVLMLEGRTADTLLLEN